MSTIRSAVGQLDLVRARAKRHLALYCAATPRRRSRPDFASEATQAQFSASIPSKYIPFNLQFDSETGNKPVLKSYSSGRRLESVEKSPPWTKAAQLGWMGCMGLEFTEDENRVVLILFARFATVPVVLGQVGKKMSFLLSQKDVLRSA